MDQEYEDEDMSCVTPAKMKRKLEENQKAQELKQEALSMSQDKALEYIIQYKQLKEILKNLKTQQTETKDACAKVEKVILYYMKAQNIPSIDTPQMKIELVSPEAKQVYPTAKSFSQFLKKEMTAEQFDAMYAKFTETLPMRQRTPYLQVKVHDWVELK